MSQPTPPRDIPGATGNVAALLRHHAGPYRGVIAVDGLVRVHQLLAPVDVDLVDVGPLEQIGEELDELLALGRRPRLPVATEGTLGRLLNVEDLDGRLAHGRPPIGPLEVRIFEKLQDLVGVLAKLFGGGARSRRHHPNQPNQHDQPSPTEHVHSNLRVSYPRMYGSGRPGASFERL